MNVCHFMVCYTFFWSYTCHFLVGLGLILYGVLILCGVFLLWGVFILLTRGGRAGMRMMIGACDREGVGDREGSRCRFLGKLGTGLSYNDMTSKRDWEYFVDHSFESSRRVVMSEGMVMVDGRAAVSFLILVSSRIHFRGQMAPMGSVSCMRVRQARIKRSRGPRSFIGRPLGLRFLGFFSFGSEPA